MSPRTAPLVTTLSLSLATALGAAPAAAQGPRAVAGTSAPRLLGVPAADVAALGRGDAAAGAARASAGDGSAGESVFDVEAARADLFGRSGALNAVVVPERAAVRGDLMQLVFGGARASYRWVSFYELGDGGVLGEAAPTRIPVAPDAGVYLLEQDASGPGVDRAAPLAVVTRVPFAAKRDGYLNGYHIGRYPTEGSGRTDQYAPPAGFIEVTPENRDFRISEHLKLGQFLTKDQFDLWPKYVALDLRLVDKLELVLQELNSMGIRAEKLHVMSGFRTPQYNGPGGDGRASLSRHMYGDAADVWVDNDGDGYMDDLNGDGRVDVGDARVMLRAVERVEAHYPELVGGAGLYVATSAHGPFIHIDTRGVRARW